MDSTPETTEDGPTVAEDLAPEEAAAALPLEYVRGTQTIRLLPPADCRARVSAIVSAVRLYHSDPTTGGSACACLLWPKLGRRARAGSRPASEYGADAFDALIGDGWTVAEAVQLGELAALHCGLHVSRLNIAEAQDF